MKRYQICSRARTTGAMLTHMVSDTPAEAVQQAKSVASTGAREVQIFDSQTEKFYDVQSFAAAHRL